VGCGQPLAAAAAAAVVDYYYFDAAAVLSAVLWTEEHLDLHFQWVLLLLMRPLFVVSLDESGEVFFAYDTIDKYQKLSKKEKSSGFETPSFIIHPKNYVT
jgi:hypothetical protein